jgi:hypothetical protein
MKKAFSGSVPQVASCSLIRGRSDGRTAKDDSLEKKGVNLGLLKQGVKDG